MNADDELLAVFRAEVGEQLNALESHVAREPGAWDCQALFHLAHNIKGAARMTATPGLMEAAHSLEDLLDALRGGAGTTPQTTGLVRKGVATLRRCFDALGSERTPDVSEYVASVVALLGSLQGAPAHAASATPDAEDAVPEAEPGSGVASDGGRSPEATIRIGIDRLDAVMGLSSELLTRAGQGEARRERAAALWQHAERLQGALPELAKHPEFRGLLSAARSLATPAQEDLADEQLSRRLQEAIRLLRMVRTDTLHGLLERVVRAAAETAGRQVRFEMVGGETEIDRAVLDGLRDPLVHLVRNAVAHGIEPADEREAAGKPRAGMVTLHTRAAGPWVELVVTDDGRGIDVERVRRRAVALGLVSAQQATGMSDEASLDLVFCAGLSTAAQVTSLAGRGVGMDVIRANLAEMGGSASLTSTLGRGTACRLRAPLTRLTSRGLLVDVADQRFAIPVMNVEHALQVEHAGVRRVEEGAVLPLGDELLPLRPLAGLLAIESTPATAGVLVVISEGARRMALHVDEVVGEHELSVQSLGWNLKEVPGIAGAAVAETGDVVLMLHPRALLDMPEQQAVRVAPQPSQRRAARVLVVDDSVTSRTLEKNILTSAGYEVRTATDGQVALEMLDEEAPDLVITDVDMPRLGGIDLVRNIRASARHSRLPTILVTSLGSEDDRRRGADAGADAYIVKGEFDQDALLRAVARLL